MCSKKVRLGNTIFEKLNLLFAFTGCVWEAGNPGLLGRLAPNLVEKVLEADKGRNCKSCKSFKTVHRLHIKGLAQMLSALNLKNGNKTSIHLRMELCKWTRVATLMPVQVWR